MLLLFGFRYILHQKFKIRVIVIIALLISIFDFIIHGLHGNGVVWSAFTLFLLCFFFDLKILLAVSSLLLLAFLLGIYQFVFSRQLYPMDANEFGSEFTAWATVFSGSVMLIVLIVAIVRIQKRQTNQLVVLLEEKNIEITQLAIHDTLTGLPTLKLATERIQMSISMARRNNNKVALLFLDLDGFKQVNDVHGHDAGDEVLKKVSKRILKEIRSHDTACRIGGCCTSLNDHLRLL